MHHLWQPLAACMYTRTSASLDGLGNDLCLEAMYVVVQVASQQHRCGVPGHALGSGIPVSNTRCFRCNKVPQICLHEGSSQLSCASPATYLRLGAMLASRKGTRCGQAARRLFAFFPHTFLVTAHVVLQTCQMPPRSGHARWQR